MAKAKNPEFESCHEDLVLGTILKSRAAFFRTNGRPPDSWFGPFLV